MFDMLIVSIMNVVDSPLVNLVLFYIKNNIILSIVLIILGIVLYMYIRSILENRSYEKTIAHYQKEVADLEAKTAAGKNYINMLKGEAKIAEIEKKKISDSQDKMKSCLESASEALKKLNEGANIALTDFNKNTK